MRLSLSTALGFLCWCDRISIAEAAPKAAEDGLRFQIVRFCHRGYRKGYAVDRHEAICPSVSALLLFGSPSAVGFAVRSIVILSLYGMLRRWSISHLGIKGLKPSLWVIPRIANRDAATAVSVIIRALRLIASSPHIDPYSINRSAIHPVDSVGNLGSGARSLSRKTSATFRYAALHILGDYHALGAAFTTAQTFWRSRGNDGPAAEAFLFCHVGHDAMESVI